jgi:hypothetical protein
VDISDLYGGGVWVVYLNDGAVAGVDGHPHAHQRAQAVRIGQRLTLHIVPDRQETLVNIVADL